MTPDDVPSPDPTPAAVEPAPEGPAPEAEVRDVVDPASVRRAPRYGAFFTVGASVGFVIGVAMGLWWLASDSSSGVSNPGARVAILIGGAIGCGVLIAAVVAVIADQRSLRGRRS